MPGLQVLERNIPDRECLKLCIASLHTALILMVELGEACSHLAASRARCCDDDERSGSLNITRSCRILITDDLFYVVWISVD